MKRALSILLSSLLAMPTTTWAKSVPMQVTQKRKVFAHKAAPVAKRAPAQAKPVKKQAKHSGKSKLSLPLMVGNQKAYTVNQKPGRSGRAESRVISGKGWRQMIVDTDGDGFADVVEVTKGKVTTTASWPYRGQFRRIDVENKLKKGVYRAKLLLSPDGKKYQLVSQNVYAYGRYHSTDSATATTAPSSGSALDKIMNTRFNPAEQTYTTLDRRNRTCESPIVISSMAALDQALRAARQATGWSMDDVMKCQVDRFQSLLIDPSCTADRDEIASALARVMSSYYDPVDSPQPGRYLQCLDNLGWKVNSTRVQEKIWGRFRDMSAEMMNAGLTAQDIAAVFADTSKCTPGQRTAAMTEIRGRSATVSLTEIARRLSAQTAEPFLKCETGVAGAHAEYRDPTIVLYNSAQNPATTANCNNCTKADAYSATIFHELVHASGFGTEQETLVREAERCCSVMSTSGRPQDRDKNSCDAAAASARYVSATQQSQTWLSTIPGYAQIETDINERFRPYNEEMMREYAGHLSTTVSKGMADLQTALDRCATDSTTLTRAACQDNAFAALSTQVREMSRKYFAGPADGSYGGRCSAWAAVSQGGATAATCAEMANRLDGMFGSAEYTDSVRAGTAIEIQVPTDLSSLQLTPTNLADLQISTPTLPPTKASLGRRLTDFLGITKRPPVASPDAQPYPTDVPQAQNQNPGPSTVADTVTSVGEEQRVAEAMPISVSEVQIPAPQIDLSSLQTITPPQIQLSASETQAISTTTQNGSNSSFGGIRQQQQSSTNTQPTTPAVSTATTSTSITTAPSSSYTPTLSSPTNSGSTQTIPYYSAGNSSGLPMPANNGSDSTGGRPDGLRSRSSAANTQDIQDAVGSALNRVSASLNSLGGRIAAAAVPEANASADLLAKTPPASPPPRAPASADPVPPNLVPAPASAPFNSYTNFSPVDGTRSRSVPAGETQSRLAGAASRDGTPASSRAGTSGSASRREGPSDPNARGGNDEDGDDRVSGQPRSKTVRPGAAAANGNSDANAEDGGSDEIPANAQANGTPRNKGAKNTQNRTLASTESAGQRQVQQPLPPRLQGFRNLSGTNMVRYVMRIDPVDMGRYMRDSNFMDKLRAEHMVIEYNGTRYPPGSPTDVPAMVKCEARHRWMVDGTCN